MRSLGGCSKAGPGYGKKPRARTDGGLDESNEPTVASLGLGSMYARKQTSTVAI